jgi:hypothetical protein
MSIVSAFYIVSMPAAPFVMAPLHPPYCFLLPGVGDCRQTCVVNHSNRLQSLHFYSSGLRIFPNVMHMNAHSHALTLISDHLPGEPIVRGAGGLRIIKETYSIYSLSFIDAMARGAQRSMRVGNEGRCGHPEKDARDR